MSYPSVRGDLSKSTSWTSTKRTRVSSAGKEKIKKKLGRTTHVHFDSAVLCCHECRGWGWVLHMRVSAPALDVGLR